MSETNRPPRKGVTAWEVEPLEENGDDFFVLTFHHGLGKMTRLDLGADDMRDLIRSLEDALAEDAEAAEEVDEDAVREVGREAGRARATWVEFDGPTEAAAFLVGYEDGDPETMDACPSPLSGEWAGESLPELSREFGLPLHLDSVADVFESAYSDGFWTEALKTARSILVGAATFDRFDIAEAYAVWVHDYADASDPYWVAKQAQLARIDFRPRPNLTLSTLDPNALGIYLGLVERTAA